jgi:NitT/TauT family transport system permease protein
MGPRQDAAGPLIPFASVAAGALAWELFPRAFASPKVPPFSSVVAAAVEMTLDGRIAQPLAASLSSLAIGLAAAAVCGTFLGFLMARSYIVEHMTSIYFDALMAAPTLTFVPVLFAIFGVTRGAQIAVVFMYAVFVITATTSSGIRAVDRRLIEMARAFGASERQVFSGVLLPASAPVVLAGLRLGTMRAVKGMVVGEMIIALSGLGALLKTYGAQFDMRGVLAVLLVIVLVSIASNLAVGALARALVGGAPVTSHADS